MPARFLHRLFFHRALDIPIRERHHSPLILMRLTEASVAATSLLWSFVKALVAAW